MKKPAPEWKIPGAYPANAGNIGHTTWMIATQRLTNTAARALLAPQQLAEGVTCGNVAKAIGAKPKTGQVLKPAVSLALACPDLKERPQRAPPSGVPGPLINEPLQRFPGVEIKSIHGNCDIPRPPKLIFWNDGLPGSFLG